MRTSCSTVVVAVGAFGLIARAGSPDIRSTEWPPAVIRAIPGGDRFRNADYLRLVAGDGLLRVAPDALFRRMTAAAQRGEWYKALFLARVFTQARPDLPAGWSNRAKLATQLGLDEEAAACAKNAVSSEAGGVGSPFVTGTRFTLEPATLADWAAALLIAADSPPVERGTSNLLVVRDDVSGVHVETREERAEIDAHTNAEDLRQYGRIGVFAEPEPIRLVNVLTGSFMMTGGEPMKLGGNSTGGSWAMTALSAFAIASGAGPAAIGASESARKRVQAAEAEKDAKAPSLMAGGKVAGVTWNGHQARIEYAPQPSGHDRAVGNPVPVLWGTGGALVPSYCGRLQNRASVEVYNSGSTNGEAKFGMSIDRVCVPKIARLQIVPAGVNPHAWAGCDGRCPTSPPLTALELALTAEDFAALMPAAASAIEPVLDRFRAEYANGTLTLLPTAGAPPDLSVRYSFQKQFHPSRGGTIGFDQRGSIYVFLPGKETYLLPRR